MNTTMKMRAIPYDAPDNTKGFVFEKVVSVKRIIITTAALLVFTLMALGVTTANAAISGWHSDLSYAQSQARSLKKPLVVMIARYDCQACTQMERNLSSPSARRAWNNAVKVRLEASQHPQMTARYAAGGTPTTLVFASGNFSSPVYSYTGIMDRNTIAGVGRSLDSM